MEILLFSSPPRGSYISIIDDELFIEYLGVLVPSTGFLYLNQEVFMDRQMNIAFSSPPRGSYISIEKYFIFTTDITGFSSPPRGSYISIAYKFGKRFKVEFSSPPRGSYISIRKLFIEKRNECLFSSPPRGSLISMKIMLFNKPSDMTVLVPSTGFSYLNTVPYTS